ncbi:hypothetical protein ACGFIG_14875 [Micromonospora sp. NPDC049048]|uniref:hypothetical protein n=1 Tax=Micromonospora sp. NPDC049048 TaxID=3364263 RepID=UPI00371B8FE4
MEDTMLWARTPEECHLYMSLHPCACGEDRFEWHQHYVIPGEERISVYEGPCPRCAATREFRFAIPDTLAPPFSFGGDQLSRIIDPAQFLQRFQRAVRIVPPDPALVNGSQRARCCAELRMGLAALREVLKFIPPGEAAVPADAFTSDVGRAAYRRQPDQFGRQRLESQLASHEKTLTAYVESVSRPA